MWGSRLQRSVSLRESSKCSECGIASAAKELLKREEKKDKRHSKVHLLQPLHILFSSLFASLLLHLSLLLSFFLFITVPSPLSSLRFSLASLVQHFCISSLLNFSSPLLLSLLPYPISASDIPLQCLLRQWIESLSLEEREEEWERIHSSLLCGRPVDRREELNKSEYERRKKRRREERKT